MKAKKGVAGHYANLKECLDRGAEFNYTFITQQLTMNTPKLGNAESTDPKPRRKTTEPSKPDKHKQEVRWYLEDVAESRKDKLKYGY